MLKKCHFAIIPARKHILKERKYTHNNFSSNPWHDKACKSLKYVVNNTLSIENLMHFMANIIYCYDNMSNSIWSISGRTESEADELLLFPPGLYHVGNRPTICHSNSTAQREWTFKSTSHFCPPIGPGRHSLPQVALRNLTLSGTS